MFNLQDTANTASVQVASASTWIRWEAIEFAPEAVLVLAFLVAFVIGAIAICFWKLTSWTTPVELRKLFKAFRGRK